VKGLSAEATARELVEWVYRTGRDVSATVKADLERGTRKAEAHTRQIVSWIFQRPSELFLAKPKATVSEREVDFLLQSLEQGAIADQLELLEFALEFLGYAKTNGVPHSDGWLAAICAEKIMRSWRGCSGLRYRVKREAFENLGLIVTVRPEWRTKNRKGRCRTYLIKVAPELSEGAAMTVGEALDYAMGKQQSRRAAGSLLKSNDRYKEVVENNLEEYRREVGEKGVKGPQACRGDGPKHGGHAAASSRGPVAIPYHQQQSELLSLPGERGGAEPLPLPSPPQVPISLLEIFLDLPLDDECRAWLRTAQPGLGIPKRYRLKIERAQWQAAYDSRLSPPGIHAQPPPEPCPSQQSSPLGPLTAIHHEHGNIADDGFT
jgi:hypothetical protein